MSDDLKDLFLDIEKKHGKGSIVVGNDFDASIPILCSTGSLGLDLALGCGGVPKGRFIQISGPESSGKTTMCMHIIREAQKAEPSKYVGFVDAEFAFDRDWATKIGVNTDTLVISQPDSGEEALDVCHQMIVSKKFSIIVLDSIAALVTKAQIEGEYGDAHMAQLARLLSQGLPKLTRVLGDTGTTLIACNQLRSNIGCISPETNVIWKKVS